MVGRSTTAWFLSPRRPGLDGPLTTLAVQGGEPANLERSPASQRPATFFRWDARDFPWAEPVRRQLRICSTGALRASRITEAATLPAVESDPS